MDMNVGAAFEIAAYVVLAMLSTVVIGYRLLRCEPSNPKLLQFIVSILLLISVSLILWINAGWFSLSEVNTLGTFFAIGAAIWLLSLFGYVIFTGYELFA